MWASGTVILLNILYVVFRHLVLRGLSNFALSFKYSVLFFFFFSLFEERLPEDTKQLTDKRRYSWVAQAFLVVAGCALC